jgi:hypothetical protein
MQAERVRVLRRRFLEMSRSIGPLCKFRTVRTFISKISPRLTQRISIPSSHQRRPLERLSLVLPIQVEFGRI